MTTTTTVGALAQALADKANAAGIKPPDGDRPGRVYTESDINELIHQQQMTELGHKGRGMVGR